MTKEEYLIFANEVLAKPEEEATKMATDKLREVIASRNINIIENDWKDVTQQFKDVGEAMNKMTNPKVRHFEPWYEFPNGSFDGRITVVYEGELSYEEAEIIVDLIVNLGAEE